MENVCIVVAFVEESECTNVRKAMETIEGSEMTYNKLYEYANSLGIEANLYTLPEFINYYNDDEINSTTTYISYLKIKKEE